jgi:hypothetical protein
VNNMESFDLRISRILFNHYCHRCAQQCFGANPYLIGMFSNFTRDETKLVSRSRKWDFSGSCFLRSGSFTMAL